MYCLVSAHINDALELIYLGEFLQNSQESDVGSMFANISIVAPLQRIYHESLILS